MPDGYTVSIEIGEFTLRPYHREILTKDDALSIARKLDEHGIEYKIEKGLLTSGGYFKENTNGQLTLEQLEKEPQN